MKTFDSLGAFASHLMTREALIAESIHDGLKIVAAKIEKTARDEIGIYQPDVGQTHGSGPGIGPFPSWPPLADSTMEDRVAKGYTENDPLLREGDLRDSIHHEVEGLVAVIGSDSDIALYQELGTVHIPPRPFLGPAVVHNERVMLDILAAAAVVGIAGPDAVPYDYKVKNDV